MTATLVSIEEKILNPAGLHIITSTKDAESEDYNGMDLACSGNVCIKFRQAKLTPKKAGNFVALWKRSASGETEPFQLSDPFDFYLIAAESDGRKGVFFFPKRALAENGVLTVEGREGKRGFRLYPAWVEAPNKQAAKTQQWQSVFFIELND